MSESILRLRAVMAATGLSRSSLYRLIKANLFPEAIPLSPKAVGWAKSEVDAWVMARVTASRDKRQPQSNRPSNGVDPELALSTTRSKAGLTETTGESQPSAVARSKQPRTRSCKPVPADSRVERSQQLPLL